MNKIKDKICTNFLSPFRIAGFSFFLLFFSLPSGGSGWASSCFSQCVSYDVHACIDVIDYLHVQGNQMWWVHQGGSNPGQHSSCSGDVLSVNGASWGNWSTPFTLSGVTDCMDMTSSVTQCSNVCALVQAPSGSNGWETIYKFDDSGPSAAHNYKINFTYCPTTITPTLTFTISSPACAGNNINFTYTGTASSTAIYNWDFGDGTPHSTAQSPGHTYASPGTYNVSLDITDCGVTTGPTIVGVTVSTPPTSTFTTTSPVCIGTNSTITYTGTGAAGDSYTWDFDSGTIVAGSGQGPYTVNWPNAGTKNITLTVDANGCVSPLTTDSIIVSPTPVSTFTAPAGKCLAGNSFSFTAGGNFLSNSTFLWTFANASPATSTLQNPVGIVFSTSGYHTVSMTFIKNGCASNTYVDSVLIYPMPIADYSVADVCLNQSMNFYDSSTVSTGTLSGWSWDFADSSPSGITQNTFHTYTNPGSYPVSLIATTNNGCKDTILKSAVVHPPPDAKFGSTNVCFGTNTLLTDLSTIPSTDTIQAWTWNLGDGSAPFITQNISHPYAAEGFYPVQLIAVSNFGCSDSITKISIVNPNPVVNFVSNDTTGCEPFCISFQNSSSITNGNNTQFLWDMGDGSPTNTSVEPSYCYTNDSIYSPNSFNVTLEVTSDSGCVSTLSKNNYITIYPNPAASFTAQPQTTSLIDPLISITDLSVGVFNWNWNFGDGSAPLTTSLPASSPAPHTYADTGTYLITLITSTQYNCLDTASQTISIESDFVFYVPAAFTPDGDGMNDTFSGKGIFIKELKMNIFDRWGNLIFVSDDIGKPWDGKANKGTNIALADVYIYSIIVTDFKNRKHNYKGIVTLLR